MGLVIWGGDEDDDGVAVGLDRYGESSKKYID